MLETLLLLCALIWLPILLHQIIHRGFFVLLAWLLIAPIVTNIVNGQTNPFFETPQDTEWSTSQAKRHGYVAHATRIDLQEVLEPTRTLLGLFLVIFLLNAICKKKRLVPLNGTETWMVIFSVILVASAFFQSIRFGYAMHHALDAFIVPFLAYYVARRLVISEDRFRLLISVLGYLSFYVIIICLIERSANQNLLYRLHGPFVGQAKLQIALMVAFYGMLIEQRTHPGGIRWFVLCLTPVIILLTWLRANWVGFLSGVWVFLFLSYRLSTPRQKLQKLGVGLMLIPMLVLGIGAVLSQDFVAQEVVEKRVSNPKNVDWRLKRWNVAIQEGIEHPFFGIGLTNLQDALGRAGLNYDTAHTSFLTFFAEQGVVGLLVYLSSVVSIIRMGSRLYRTGANPQDRWRGAAVIAVLVTHQMPSFFYNELHSYHLGHIYAYVFVGGIAGLYSRHRLVPAQYAFSKQHHQLSTTR